MRFLCDHCKAKYQIADEKVAGRLLRMRCRRCGQEILFSGRDAVPSTEGASAVDRSQPEMGAGAPGERNRGQARLGEGFERGRKPGSRPHPIGLGDLPSEATVAGPAPEAVLTAEVAPVWESAPGNPSARRPSQRPAGPGGFEPRRPPSPPDAHAPRTATVLDQWHVAINDVPVGPIRREELARKIAAGAVRADSLVWREGLAEWQPLKDIPELTALLRSRALATPPPVTRSMNARAPSAAGRAAGITSSGTRRAAGVEPSAARSNVVPLSARFSGAGHPSEAPAALASAVARATIEAKRTDPDAGLAARLDPVASPAYVAPTNVRFDDTPLAVEIAPVLLVDTDSHAAPRRARRTTLRAPVSWPLVGVIVIGAPFAITMSALLYRHLDRRWSAPSPALVAQNSNNTVGMPSSSERVPVAAVDPLAEAPEPSGDVPALSRAGGAAHSSRRGPAPAPSAPAPKRTLTASERAMLERMSGESAAAPANLGPSGGGAESGARGGSELSPEQLRRVVNENRPSLSRCYDLSIRGVKDPPTLRVDVDLTIGGSGVVTGARVRGASAGPLEACLEQSVRRWRFPTSGQTTQTSFPVLFAPGS